MKSKTIRHLPRDKDYIEVIMINQIARLSKSQDGETTYIHLINGDIMESDDSINTLEARLES